MKKTVRVLVVALTVAFLVLAGFFNMFGLYVKVPGKDAGSTAIYLRRGSGLPFMLSADGYNIERGIGVSAAERNAAETQLDALLSKRIIFTLPYIRQAYLSSTGNVDFESLGKPKKPTEAARTGDTVKTSTNP